MLGGRMGAWVSEWVEGRFGEFMGMWAGERTGEGYTLRAIPL